MQEGNAKRKAWDDAQFTQVLKQLKTTNLKTTARQLGLSVHSLRHRLYRRGIGVRDFRRHAKADVQRIARARSFVAPLPLPEENPFWAMEAIEAKSDRGCSWPIGETAQAGFHFCNKPKQVGKPYCVECAAKAYLPAPPLEEYLKKHKSLFEPIRRDPAKRYRGLSLFRR